MVKRNRPFGRCRCTLENNIKTEQKQVDWEGIYWILLVREPMKALMNMVILMTHASDRAISQYEWCQVKFQLI
jgi:hypothetical protein